MSLELNAGAIEAGGVNNGTVGVDPSGNVLAQYGGVNARGTKTVVSIVRHGVLGNGAAYTDVGKVGELFTGWWGNLLINADGSYTYTVNNANAQVQALRNADDTLTDTFSYTVRDAAGVTTTNTLKVTIHGANDAPVAVADTAEAVEAGGYLNNVPGINPGGNVLANDTDVDRGDTKVVSSVAFGALSHAVGRPLTSAYGSLLLNADGSYTYTVNNNNPAVQALRTSADTLSETFRYTVRDAAGATSTSTLTVTIHGADDNPRPPAELASATEAGGVANTTPGVDPQGELLRGRQVDVDAGDTATVTEVLSGIRVAAPGTSLAGDYGHLVLDADGHYRYTVDNDNPEVQALRGAGDTLTDTFTYTVQDAAGATGVNTLRVTIHGANDNPAPAEENDTVTAVEAGGVGNRTPGVDPHGNLLGLFSDVDAGDTLTVRSVWDGRTRSTASAGVDLVAQYGTFRVDANGDYSFVVDNDNPTVQALRTRDDVLYEVFVIKVGDAAGSTVENTLTVRIQGADDAPVAVADSADALEAGGVRNGTPGTDPSGNLLANDTDVDAGDTRTVVIVDSGPHDGIVGQPLAGRYGSIVIDADGSYRYTVDNDNAAVQALRTSSQTLADTFYYTMKDAAGATSSSTLTVTIHGANDNPAAGLAQATVHAAGHAGAGAGSHASGNLLDSVSDVDAGDAKVLVSVTGPHGGPAVDPGSIGEFTSVVPIDGRYGTLDLSAMQATPTGALVGADGSYDYTVDNDNAAVKALGVGQTLHDTFTYRVRDAAGGASTGTLDITIEGANDAPVATTGSATLAEDAYVNFHATTLGSVPFDDGPAPAVRIDSLPSQGAMTLFGQPLSVGQVVKVDDVARIQFKQQLFSLQSFGYTDIDNGDSIQSVRIDSLPANGQLGLHGRTVEAGQRIAVADLQDLVFKPARDFNGDTSFRYSMQDAAGDFSPVPGTFTLHVTPVNDTPTIDQVVSQDVREGGLTRLEGLHFGDVDAGGNAVTVKLHVNAGTLRSAGTGQVQVDGDGTDTLVLTGTLADINGFVASGAGVSYAAPTDARPGVDATVERLDALADPTVRIVMHATQGSFTASEKADIAVTGVGTGTLTIVGRASQVGDYLEHEVTHSQAATTNLLEVRINDNGNAGQDPGLTGEADNEKAYSFTSLVVVPEGHDLREPYVAGATDAGPGLSATTIAGMAAGVPLLLAGMAGAGSGIQARGIGDVFSFVWNKLFGPPAGADPGYFPMDEFEDGSYSSGDESSWAQHDAADRAKRAGDGYEKPNWESNPDSPLDPLVPVPPGGTGAPGWTLPPLTAPFLDALAALLGLGVGAVLPLVLHFKPAAADTHVNAAPTIGLEGGSELNVYQGENTPITGLRFADSDAGDDLVKVKLWLGQGTLQATPVDGDGVTVTSNSGLNPQGVQVNEVNLAGKLSDINAFIEAGKLSYTADLLGTGSVKLYVVISDNGSRGVDPGAEGQGGTGGTQDEQAALTLTLNIQPVNHAPESADATITVQAHDTHVFTTAEFAFSDPVDSNNRFAGIRITAPPQSGQLTLNGAPLVFSDDVAFVPAQDIADGKLVFAPANAGTAQDSTAFTFQVQDDGGVEHGGSNTSAPHTMSLKVEHAPLLSVGASSFDEARQAQAPLAKDVLVTDVDAEPAGITTVKLTITQPHAGDSWAVDTARFADAWAQLGLGDHAPTVNVATTGENAFALSFSSGTIPIAAAQALIGSLVWRSDSPNVDEGTRAFTLQLVDEQGQVSNIASASVQVESSFGQLERAIEADSQHIAGFVSQTTAPVESFADDQQQALMDWIGHRGELAQAVWEALSKAPVKDGVLELGASITQALDVLGVHYAQGTAKPSIDIAAQPDTLFVDSQAGTVRLSTDYRAALLTQMVELRDSMRLSQYAEAADALAEAEQAGTDDVWRVPHAAWLVAWLDATGVTQPGQLATDASGDLSLSAAAVQELLSDLDQHRVAEQGRHSPYAEAASYMLAQGTAQGGAWTGDPALLHWLDVLGIPHQVPVQLAALPAGENLVHSVLQPGSLALTIDGQLVMSPVTANELARALADAMAAGKADTSAVSDLQGLLQAATATDGVYALAPAQAHLLEDAGVSFHAVSALSDTALAGEAARSAPDGAVFFTEQTRASWLAQLQALGVAADPLQPTGGAVGELLLVLESLQRATDTSFYGTPQQQVACSNDLLELLLAQGVEVDDLTGSTEAQRDAFVPGRILSMAASLHAFKLGDTLLISSDLVDALRTELARGLQDIGLDLGSQAVPPAEETPWADATPVDAAHQQQAQHPAVLPPGKAMSLLNETGHALGALFDHSSLQSLNGAASAPISARVFDIDADLFTSLMAAAGIQMKNLGSIDRLDAAGAAALGDAAQPALSRTDDGSLVLSEATFEALQSQLNAQYFRERADLARSAQDALLHDQPDAHLSILQPDGTTLHDTPASGVDMVVVDDAVLLTLVQLGIPATLQARTSQPTEADLEALRSNVGSFVIDEVHGQLLMSEATRSALLQKATDQEHASQRTAHTIDPASVPDAGDAGDPAAAAFDPARMAGLNHLLGDVRGGVSLYGDGFVYMPADSDFLAQLASHGIAVTDLGRFDEGAGSSAAAFDASAHPDTFAVARTDDGWFVVSAATQDAWTSRLSAEAAAAGGDLEGRHQFDAKGMDEQAVNWQAHSQQVEDFDAIEALLTPVLVGSSFESFAGSEGPVSLWRVPAGVHLSVQALSARLGGLQLTDLGSLDTSAASTIDALLQTTHGVVSQPDGSLLMSASTREAIAGALNGELTQARQDVSAHAVQELLDAGSKDGYLVLQDSTLMHDLARLGLGNFGQLVSSESPDFGELAVNGKSQLLLTDLTRRYLLSEIGAVEPLSDSAKAALPTLLATLNEVKASPEGDVAVPPGAGLSLAQGWLSLHDGGAFDDSAAGHGQLQDAPPGTVQHGADGTLYMSVTTMNLLLSELDGAAANGITGGSLATGSAGYLTAAAGTLSGLEQLETVRSHWSAPNDGASTQEAHTGWWQAFRSWLFEPASASGLVQQAESLGLPLNKLDIASDAQLADAVRDGKLKQAYTVVIDADGNALMSTDTRDALVSALLEQVRHGTGVDWSPQYGDGSGSVNAFAASLGMLAGAGEGAAEGLRRSVSASGTDWLGLQDGASTLLATLQLDNQVAANGGNTYGTKATAAQLEAFQNSLNQFGLDGHGLTLKAVSGSDILTDDQYAITADGQVVMTAIARDGLLKTAQAVVDQSELQAQHDVAKAFGYTPGERLDGPLLEFDTGALPAGYERIIPLSPVTLKDAQGASHRVDFDTLQATALEAARPDAPADFRTQAVQYMAADGAVIDTTKGALLDLHDALVTGGGFYALTKNGADIVVSTDGRNAILAETAERSQAASSSIAQTAEATLDQAVDDPATPGVKTFPADAILSQLDALGIPYFLTTDRAQVPTLANAVYLNGQDAYVSADTLARLQAGVDAVIHHSTASASQALQSVLDGTLALGDGDLFHAAAKVQAIPAVAHDSAGNTLGAKTLVGLALSGADMQALRDKGFVGNWSSIGDLSTASQDQYDSLWQSGQIAEARVGSQTVFVMNEDTLAALESKITNAGTTTQWGLRAVDASLVDDLIAAGIPVLETHSLPVNGQSRTQFTKATELDSALHDALPGTVFVDATGAAWISGDTQQYLQKALGAALHANGAPVVGVAQDALPGLFAAYDRLQSIFTGFDPASRGYFTFGTDSFADLQALGIRMNFAGVNTASLANAPVFSYVNDADGNPVVDARTYQAITGALALGRFSLETSLFQNEWHSVSYVGSDGLAHTYWRSVGEGAQFADVLERAHLPLNQLTLQGLSLDTLDGTANSYMVDATGHVLVSDATHARIEPILALETQASRKSFTDAVGAALHNAVTHHADDFVVITDPALVDSIHAYAARHAPDFLQHDVDLQNLNREVLSFNGKYVLGNLDNGIVISAETRDALAAAGGIQGLTGAGTPLAGVPDVVEVKSSLVAGLLQSQFGLSPGSLHDASGAVIASSSIDGDALGDDAREQLAAGRLVVADKDGDLLMSSQTWQSLMTQADRAIAVAGQELSGSTQTLLDSAADVPVHNGVLMSLPGDASNWLDMFRAMGVPYKLVNGALDPSGNADQELFDPSGSGQFAVGIDAAGGLVMSRETAAALAGANAVAKDIYTASQGASLSSVADGALPAGTFSSLADLTWNASLYASVLGSTGNWYRLVTSLRYLTNSGTATDTSVLLTHYGKDINQLLTEFESLSVADRVKWAGVIPDSHLLFSGEMLRQIAVARVEYSDNIFTAQRYFNSFGNGGFEIVGDENTAFRQLTKIIGESRSLASAVFKISSAAIQDGEENDDTLYAVSSSSSDDNVLAMPRVSPRNPNSQNIRLTSSQVNDEITKFEAALRKDLAAALNPDTPSEERSKKVSKFLEELDTLRLTLEQRIQLESRAIQNQADGMDEKLDRSLKESSVVEHIRGQQQAYADLANRLQVLRFFGSLLNIPGVVAKGVDAANMHRQYSTVLGDTPEAEALRSSYYMKTVANSFGTFASLASLSQVIGYYGFYKPSDTLKKHMALITKQWDDGYNNAFFNVPDRTPLMNLLKDYAPRSNPPLWPLQGDLVDGHYTFAPLKLNGVNLIYQAANLSYAMASVLNLVDLFGTVRIEGMSYAAGSQIVQNLWGAVAGIVLDGADLVGYGWSADRYLSAMASRAAGWGGKINFGVLAADLVGQTTMMGVSHAANWGVWLNTLWNATASGAALAQVVSPLQAVLAQLVAPNFVSAQNAANASKAYQFLQEQGLTEDAAHQLKVYYSELIRSLPVGVIWFPAAAIYDAAVGTNVWSPEDFQNSARQRIQLLDAPTAANRPADAAVAIAKQFGLPDVYVIRGTLVDYGVNPNNIQVVKADVVHHVVNGVAEPAQIAFYDASVKVTGSDNLANPSPIKLSASGIDLGNKTGNLVTYVIAPPETIQTHGTNVTVRTASPEVDLSRSSEDSVNQIIDYDPQALIRGGPGIDLYFLTQALQPVLDSQGQRVAGYIIDGVQNPGTDLVSFRYADATDANGGGHVIHTGVDDSGVKVYEGISVYEGSAYNDLFTRYGANVSDAEMVYRGGGGNDTFDLRGGNNSVELGASGVVHLDLSNRPAGADLALPLGIFANLFTKADTNWVGLSNAAGGDWFEVYGNSLSTDIVDFSAWSGSGLSFAKLPSGTTVDGHAVPGGAYLVSDLSDSAKARGFFNDNVDQLYGTPLADRIDIDSTSKLKLVDTIAGDDEVRVDKGDVTVIGGAGNAHITLEAGATNATVYASSGNTVNVDTVDGVADHVVTVYANGTVSQPAVKVDASEATADLQVLAVSGVAYVIPGKLDSTIVIDDKLGAISIDDNGQRLGALNIGFLDAKGNSLDDNGFDLSQLYFYDTAGNKVEGFRSELLRDGVTTKYDTTWHTESGNEVGITIFSDGTDLSLGAYTAAGTGLHQLDQLLAQPQPAPVHA